MSAKKISSSDASVLQANNNLTSRNIFIVMGSISFLLVALSIAYYFILVLPKLQSQKIELERDKYATEKALELQKTNFEEEEKMRSKSELDICLTNALTAYHDNWERDCKIHKEDIESQIKRCQDSRNMNYNSCKESGLEESFCKSQWLDTRDSYCKSQFEYKEEENGNCLLPNTASERNNTYLSDKKDECYKRFEIQK
jgi:hypothetical protein